MDKIYKLGEVIEGGELPEGLKTTLDSAATGAEAAGLSPRHAAIAVIVLRAAVEHGWRTEAIVQGDEWSGGWFSATAKAELGKPDESGWQTPLFLIGSRPLACLSTSSIGTDLVLVNIVPEYETTRPEAEAMLVAVTEHVTEEDNWQNKLHEVPALAKAAAQIAIASRESALRYLGYEASATTLSGLPIEVIARMSEWLCAEDVLNLTSVSRGLLRTARADAVWRPLYRRDFHAEPPQSPSAIEAYRTALNPPTANIISPDSSRSSLPINQAPDYLL